MVEYIVDDMPLVIFVASVLVFSIIVGLTIFFDYENEKHKKILSFNKKFNYKKIDNIYKEFIEKNITKYNAYALKIKRTNIFILISIVIIPIFILMLFIIKEYYVLRTIIFIMIIILTVLTLYSYEAILPKLREEKNIKFKEKLIKYIIDECLNDFTYEEKGYMPESIYNSSKFYEKYDIYFCEDLMKGKMHESDVSLVEIETLSKTTETSKQKPIFHGMFIHMKLNNSFKDNLIITTKDEVIENRTISYTNNEVFNNYFNTYTNDLIMTNEFLNDELVNRLLELYVRYGITIDIKINKKDAYLRFFTGPMFDTLIFTREEKKKVYLFYSVCLTINEIAKELNKNNK